MQDLVNKLIIGFLAFLAAIGILRLGEYYCKPTVLDDFRKAHPEYDNLSDDEIMMQFCAKIMGYGTRKCTPKCYGTSCDQKCYKCWTKKLSKN